MQCRFLDIAFVVREPLIRIVRVWLIIHDRSLFGAGSQKIPLARRRIAGGIALVAFNLLVLRLLVLRLLVARFLVLKNEWSLKMLGNRVRLI